MSAPINEDRCVDCHRPLVRNARTGETVPDGMVRHHSRNRCRRCVRYFTGDDGPPDWVVVDRAVHGYPPPGIRRCELLDAALILSRRGHTEAEIGDLLRVHRRTVERLFRSVKSRTAA